MLNKYLLDGGPIWHSNTFEYYYFAYHAQTDVKSPLITVRVCVGGVGVSIKVLKTPI